MPENDGTIVAFTSSVAKQDVFEPDSSRNLVSPPKTATIPMPVRCRGAIVAAATTVATVVLVVIEWYLSIEVLERIGPSLVAMNPLTAVTFLVAAFCLGNLGVQKCGRRTFASLWLATKPINVEKFFKSLDRTLSGNTQPAVDRQVREMDPAFAAEPQLWM